MERSRIAGMGIVLSVEGVGHRIAVDPDRTAQFADVPAIGGHRDPRSFTLPTPPVQRFRRL